VPAMRELGGATFDSQGLCRARSLSALLGVALPLRPLRRQIPRLPSSVRTRPRVQIDVWQCSITPRSTFRKPPNSYRPSWPCRSPYVLAATRIPRRIPIPNTNPLAPPGLVDRDAGRLGRFRACDRPVQGDENAQKNLRSALPVPTGRRAGCRTSLCLPVSVTKAFSAA
jgi:hypothetical protein